MAERPRKIDATVAFVIIDLSLICASLFRGCALLPTPGGLALLNPHRLAVWQGLHSWVLFAFDCDRRQS